jgi:hypothetical protein
MSELKGRPAPATKDARAAVLRRPRGRSMTPGAVKMRERRAQRSPDGTSADLLGALLAHLPDAGEAWTAERRAAWLALAGHIMGAATAF